MKRSIALLALTGVATCWLHAQMPKPAAAARPQYPVVTLKFGEPEPAPLGRKGTVMLDNPTCAPDGTLFMPMYSVHPSAGELVWALRSFTDGTDAVSYTATAAPGYQNISGPYKYFASDNAVVTLVGAAPLSNAMEESKRAAWRSATLALVYDRKGTLERVVPIPAKIDPRSIGMYSSGDLLVVAKDASTKRLRLLVLDHDGDIKNELSLFDYDYEANRKAAKGQPLAKLDQTDLIHIISHGDDLLLVPQGTQATVIEVNEHGIVRATNLDLPHGYIIRSLISSDGPYWTLSTYTDAKVLNVKASGLGSVTFHDGPLFQFNSFDGSLVRRINIPPKLYARSLCEHNGEFIATKKNKKTGRLEMLTGSVPR